MRSAMVSSIQELLVLCRDRVEDGGKERSMSYPIPANLPRGRTEADVAALSPGACDAVPGSWAQHDLPSSARHDVHIAERSIALFSRAAGPAALVATLAVSVIALYH